MLGVQQRVAERLAGRAPAHDAVAADRPLPRPPGPGGEVDVEPQRVADHAGPGDRPDRLHALVGQQRGQVAEIAAVAVAAPEFGARHRGRAGPQLEPEVVGASAPARAVGAGLDADPDRAAAARRQRERARGKVERELGDVLPAVELERRLGAPRLDPQRLEEPGAARHQQVDAAVVVAPVASAVEQVHVTVLVGEFEVRGPHLHAGKVDRFRLGPMSFLRRVV